MAGYDDTKKKIINALLGRPSEEEIQPDKHQGFALNLLEYIRGVEITANGPLVGVAYENTVPIQPDSSRAAYIAGVAQEKTAVFENFIQEDGRPVTIKTGEMEGNLVILIWNTRYWSYESIPTNIISQSNQANFYYNLSVRKTYASIALMNADVNNPIGNDGKYIKVGEIVSVVNSTTPSENGIYSRTEDGWQFQSGMNFALVQETGTDPNVAMSQKAVTEIITEYNVSVQHPTSGLDGTNKYTLSGAIALIPVALRTIGLKCSFLNVDGKVETWEYQGGTFTNLGSWVQQIRREELTDLESEIGNIYIVKKYYEVGKHLVSTFPKIVVGMPYRIRCELLGESGTVYVGIFGDDGDPKESSILVVNGKNNIAEIDFTPSVDADMWGFYLQNANAIISLSVSNGYVGNEISRVNATVEDNIKRIESLNTEQEISRAIIDKLEPKVVGVDKDGNIISGWSTPIDDIHLTKGRQYKIDCELSENAESTVFIYVTTNTDSEGRIAALNIREGQNKSTATFIPDADKIAKIYCYSGKQYGISIKVKENAYIGAEDIKQIAKDEIADIAISQQTPIVNRIADACVGVKLGLEDYLMGDVDGSGNLTTGYNDRIITKTIHKATENIKIVAYNGYSVKTILYNTIEGEYRDTIYSAPFIWLPKGTFYRLIVFKTGVSSVSIDDLSCGYTISLCNKEPEAIITNVSVDGANKYIDISSLRVGLTYDISVWYVKNGGLLRVKTLSAQNESNYTINTIYSGDLIFPATFKFTKKRGDEIYLLVYVGYENQPEVRTKIYKSDDKTYDDLVIDRTKSQRDAVISLGYSPLGQDTIPPLTFMHISDTHGNIRYNQCVKNAITIMNTMSFNDSGKGNCVKFLLHTGDIHNSNPVDDYTHFTDAIALANRPVFVTAGNHDVGETKEISKCYTDMQVYDKIISPLISSWELSAESGTPHPSDSNYYFKDFQYEKVRMIVLYEFESDMEMASSTMLKYVRGVRTFRQTQVDWFIDSLLTTPIGYGVIVVKHQPEDYNGNDDNSFNSLYHRDTKFCSTHGSGTLITDIVRAFINKETINKSYVQNGGIITTLSANADFSNVNEGVEFICYCSGHTHRDHISKLRNYPEQLELNIGCDNVNYCSSSDIAQIEGTINEDIINVYSIDRNRGYINIARIGGSVTNTMQKRDVLSINYRNK